jgi:hypothetical protein
MECGYEAVQTDTVGTQIHRLALNNEFHEPIGILLL